MTVNLDWQVAGAIAHGLLSEAEAGPEVLDYLGRHIAFARAHMEISE